MAYRNQKVVLEFSIMQEHHVTHSLKRNSRLSQNASVERRSGLEGRRSLAKENALNMRTSMNRDGTGHNPNDILRQRASSQCDSFRGSDIQITRNLEYPS